MHTGTKLKPGQKGTKKMLAEYGSRLLCVRYRYDAERRKRYKTVELIVDERPWEPPRRDGNEIVKLRVGALERDWQRKVRAAGGRWNPSERLWELSYGKALEIGAESRLVRK
jgi:hypothetical protein